MNMKLLAGLAVAITLASAMTFVGLSSKMGGATAGAGEPTVVPGLPPTTVDTTPDPSATSGLATMKSQVKVGGDVIKTSVTVK